MALARDTGTRVTGRWVALALYVAAIYASLPFGPRLGFALLRTAPGSWLLGGGLPLLTVAGALGLAGLLCRRRAPAFAYVLLALAGAGYVIAFSWLRAAHLERTHLPEYGLAAWLTWRAVGPLLPNPLAGYVAGAAIGTAIGYGDELLQSVVPGRYYDLRDVAMNAVGAILGMMVVAAVRSGSARHKAATTGRSAEIATHAASL